MSLERPLSPHLQIYKWQITNFMSIMHRASGIFLFIAIISGIIVLSNIINNFPSYNYKIGILSKLIISTSIIAIIYHALNGIRYMLFDTIMRIDNKSITYTGIIVISITSIISIIVLYITIKHFF